MSLLILVILYGVLALVRELCVVKYYGSVVGGRALSASALNLVIGLLDSVALVVVFERIVSGWGLKAILPLVVYEISGSVGTYLGVNRKK